MMMYNDDVCSSDFWIYLICGPKSKFYGLSLTDSGIHSLLIATLPTMRIIAMRFQLYVIGGNLCTNKLMV